MDEGVIKTPRVAWGLVCNTWAS